MLRTNSVESRKVWSGIPASLPALYAQVFLHPSIVLLKNTVILAQRVALPFFGQQNPRHVRMPRELDAEHVEHFALQPVGRQVYVYCRFGLVAFRNIRLHPYALIPGE